MIVYMWEAVATKASCQHCFQAARYGVRRLRHTGPANPTSVFYVCSDHEPFWRNVAFTRNMRYVTSWHA